MQLIAFDGRVRTEDERNATSDAFKINTTANWQE
jgi:hypothetical protein